MLQHINWASTSVHREISLITSRICPCYDEEQGISFHYRPLLLPGAMKKFPPKTALIISCASVPTFMLPTLQCEADPKMTEMRKPLLSLNIPPLHLLQSPQILFFHNLLFFWPPVPLLKYREWRIQVSICNKQRGRFMAQLLELQLQKPLLH